MDFCAAIFNHMIDHSHVTEEQLDLVFRALGDSTRRRILKRLAQSESCTVGELAEPFEMSLNAVSKHLKVLEKAGLLRRRRDGRIHRCAADLKPLEPAGELLAQYRAFWTDRLDELEAYLNLEETQ